MFTIPTPSEFKAQFPRDFPYAVPAWGASGLCVLSSGGVGSITVLSGGQGYTESPTVVLGAPPAGGTQATATTTVLKGKVAAFVVTAAGTGYTSPPSVTISGGAGDETDLKRVTDADIIGATVDARFNTNQSLFADQTSWTRGFNYLVAHYLVEKLLAAGEGLASQYNWLTTGKSVGDVAEQFGIPKQIMDSPMLAAFSKTRYGAMYVQIIAPQLAGNLSTHYRQSLP